MKSNNLKRCNFYDTYCDQIAYFPFAQYYSKIASPNNKMVIVIIQFLSSVFEGTYEI